MNSTGAICSKLCTEVSSVHGVKWYKIAFVLKNRDFKQMFDRLFNYRMWNNRQLSQYRRLYWRCCNIYIFCFIQAFGSQFGLIVSAIVTLGGTFAVAFHATWKLTLLMMLFLPFLLLAGKLVRSLFGSETRKADDEEAGKVTVPSLLAFLFCLFVCLLPSLLPRLLVSLRTCLLACFLVCLLSCLLPFLLPCFLVCLFVCLFACLLVCLLACLLVILFTYWLVDLFTSSIVCGHLSTPLSTLLSYCMLRSRSHSDDEEHDRTTYGKQRNKKGPSWQKDMSDTMQKILWRLLRLWLLSTR